MKITLKAEILDPVLDFFRKQDFEIFPNHYRVTGFKISKRIDSEIMADTYFSYIGGNLRWMSLGYPMNSIEDLDNLICSQLRVHILDLVEKINQKDLSVLPDLADAYLEYERRVSVECDVEDRYFGSAKLTPQQIIDFFEKDIRFFVFRFQDKAIIARVGFSPAISIYIEVTQNIGLRNIHGEGFLFEELRRSFFKLEDSINSGKVGVEALEELRDLFYVLAEEQKKWISAERAEG